MATGKRIPAAEIRRVWLDERLTTAQAAEAVGLARSNLWHRARALGLPPRKNGRRFEIMDLPRFTRMWDAGVHGPQMAEYFGVTYSAVRATARRHGLAPRPLGTRPKVTLYDFLQMELGERMRASAASVNARLREVQKEAA
jgi:hypothetical protein